MSHTYTNLLSHIVFSTQGHLPLITEEIKKELFRYMGGLVNELGGKPIIINGMSDDVHILAKLRPDKAVSDVRCDLKSNASGWMHDVFPDADDFSWQNGYGAFSVGPSEIERIRKYIANQKEHHGRHSFEEEFVELLKVHEIEFDPRHLWT